MYNSLKEEAFKANIALPRPGLINLTFGNVSVFDPAKRVFAIKLSGVPYEVLKWTDMIVLNLDGNKAEGTLNPSSDTPTHRNLYRVFNNIT